METNKDLVQGTLDDELERDLKTPTGLPMEKSDGTDYDLRREIQAKRFDEREPWTTVVLKNFVDQTEEMRAVNRRARIRSRR